MKAEELELVPVVVAVPVSDAASRRRAMLERGAKSAGDDWVERTHARLAGEGRAREGGWPGTIREARALTADYSTTLSSALTFDEGEWVTKVIYGHAKREWRLQRESSG